MLQLKLELGSSEILNSLRKEKLGDSSSLCKRILDFKQMTYFLIFQYNLGYLNL